MSLDFAYSTAAAPAAPGISVLPGASFSTRSQPSSQASEGAPASFDLVFDSRQEAGWPVDVGDPIDAPEADADPDSGTATAVQVDEPVPALEGVERRDALRADFEALIAFSQPAGVPQEPVAPVSDGSDAPEPSGFEHIIPATAGDVREWIERTVTREASREIQGGIEEAEVDSFRQSLRDIAEAEGDPGHAAGERREPAPAIANLPGKARTADSDRAPATQRIADAVSAYVNNQMVVQHGAKPDADSGGEWQGHQFTGRHDRPTTATHALATAAAPQFVLNEVGAAMPAAAAPAGAPQDARLAESIVQTIRMQWFQGSGTAVLSLEPEYLGGVTVALQVEKGSVTATLHADDPNVRAWMAANEPLLRQGLAEQGLSLERLVIAEERAADAQAEARRRARRQPAESKPPTRRRDTSTFAVIV